MRTIVLLQSQNNCSHHWQSNEIFCLTSFYLQDGCAAQFKNCKQFFRQGKVTSMLKSIDQYFNMKLRIGLGKNKKVKMSEQAEM